MTNPTGRRAGKRRFVDAPQWARCVVTIKLRDGSRAQCGRVAKHTGQLCTQHHKIATPTRAASAGDGQ